MGQPATGCGFLTLSARPRAPSARPRGASSGVMPRNNDASRGLGHRVRRAVPSIPAAQHGGGRGGGWRGPVLWMPPPRQLCQGRYHGARVRGPPLGGAGGAARAGVWCAADSAGGQAIAETGDARGGAPYPRLRTHATLT